MIYTIWNKKESKNIAEDKMMIYIVKNINTNKYNMKKQIKNYNMKNDDIK